jgi:MscS family membrane protein
MLVYISALTEINSCYLHEAAAQILFFTGEIMSRIFIIFYAALITSVIIIAAAGLYAEEKFNPLEPVQTDSPRDTMKTFMDAMNRYRNGLIEKDDALIADIDRAVRCFDLDQGLILDHKQKYIETAVLLKEVIDRVIIIDYNKIPDASEGSIPRWRLKNTEITIARQETGDRAGEYLFSRDTSNRVREFFSRVRHLPYLKGSGGGASFQETWFEENVPLWAKDKLLFLPTWQWIGLFISILSGLVLKLLVSMFIDLLKFLSKNTEARWSKQIISTVASPVGYLAATGLWYASIQIIGFEGTILTFLRVTLKVILSIVIIWIIYRLMNVLSEYLLMIASKTESTLDDQLVPLLNRAMKIFIIIFGVLVAGQNLGLNVMSVLAGLGIGGFAIALAAKDMVANFFGSLMILFDSPFQVGDWIVIGSTEGTVEEIGFRSTKIRTFYNSLISVPNSELAIKEIDNMGRREFRRVKTILGVTYDTPPEKMEAFLEGIKNIIKANAFTKKDGFYVAFEGYGASSLDILVYFFLNVADRSSEIAEKQNIFIEILRLAKELDVDFAFPTQSLHVETFPEKETVRRPWEKDIDSVKETAESFGPDGKNAKPGGLGIYTPLFKE